MKRIMPLVLCLLLLLSGCAGGESVTIDTGALARSLLEGGVFDEPLNAVEPDAIRLLVGEELTGEEILAYLGTGATAEELLIVTAAGEEAAEDCLALLQDHLDERRELYAGYLPGEVYKLENACLERFGRYVILCVAADFETAGALIDSAAAG